MQTTEDSNLLNRVKQLRGISEAFGLLKLKDEASYVPIKIALNPFESTQKTYDHLGNLQKVWQKLLFSAAEDSDLINQVYKNISKNDPMIKQMISIYKQKKDKDSSSFTFVRCDYFFDQNQIPKLIQYNLVAVSMSVHTQNLHRAQVLCETEPSSNYPINRPNQDFAVSVKTIYNHKHLKGLFVFVASSSQRNIIEHRLVEASLRERGILCQRISLYQFGKKLKLDQQNDLFLDGKLVSFVYYRTGYQLCDFTECDYASCWQTKKIIENSNAFKIPTITMELMNQKRMQVQLSKPEVYSRFLSIQQAEILKTSLVKTWQFDNMENKEFNYLIQKIKKENPQNYIAKPNLEGGGNNIYGLKAVTTLEELSENDRKKYILMEKIHTLSIENVLVQGPHFAKLQCKYEISRYGFITKIDSKLTQNQQSGYLIRAKPQHENEGGVMAGVGSICAWKFKNKA